MCGIAGLIVAGPARVDTQSVAERMRAKLVHRGPDDAGLFVSQDRRCALAHTRLSILDLSPAGHQPMCSADGRYSIVFNGEIYNYRELREELGAGGGEQKASSREQGAKSREQGAGREEQIADGEWQMAGNSGQRSAVGGQPSAMSHDSWRSNSDTEVILRAYSRWGVSFLQKLRGMFAIAVWDNQKQQLMLARDPFGIKPLYYHATANCFAFASEMRALLGSDLLPRRLNPEGLVSYLQFGSVQDPLTMVKGARALLPGHYLVVARKKDALTVKEIAYADQFKTETPAHGISNRSEAVAELRQILEDSLRQHLVSDVPVGAFLSGGIDSSALVALLSQVAGDKPKTFSVVFAESDFSEAAHAQMIAKMFATEHREILLSEEGLLGLLPSALQAMDRPTMDGINTYVISKAAKEAGITVALSGLGGDELFAGYPSFRRAEQMRRLALLPQSVRRSASKLGRALLHGSARQRKFWDMVASDCSPCAAYTISRELFAPAEIAAVLHDSFPILPFTSCACSTDVVNVVAVHELTGYMANTLLRDTDQMSMAHALEVRVPFIDPVVVRYVLGLPGRWKMDRHRPKPLLLEALGELLPEEVWRRPKMGFTLPFQRWLRSALEPEVDEAFMRGDGLTHLGLHTDAVRKVWREFKNNPQEEPWSRPWALYVLKKWCDHNNISL
jgi:asparagine synthase (glutamine-hydrolysing)